MKNVYSSRAKGLFRHTKLHTTRSDLAFIIVLINSVSHSSILDEGVNFLKGSDEHGSQSIDYIPAAMPSLVNLCGSAISVTPAPVR